MEFRFARHALALNPLEQFYTRILGFEKLGKFKNHAGYDGLFLGFPDSDWHLEFTTSKESPVHHFDEDDRLVFYLNSETEMAELRKIIQKEDIPLEIPKNPYWSAKSIQISDPEGYKIVCSLKTVELQSEDKLTRIAREKSGSTWSQLIHYVRDLPYGRNLNRQDLSLVLSQGRGTCSSKHALLKEVADLNQIHGVKLMLGIYKMQHDNTPGIGQILVQNGLEYLPEAHCYLKLNYRRFDLTTSKADFRRIENDLLEEIEITPEQVATFKVNYHKAYLKKWLKEHLIERSFDQIWDLRERCIGQLEIPTART